MLSLLRFLCFTIAVTLAFVGVTLFVCFVDYRITVLCIYYVVVLMLCLVGFVAWMYSTFDLFAYDLLLWVVLL